MMSSCTTLKFEIPKGLPAILHRLSKAILRDQPEKLYEFSAKFLEAELCTRDQQLEKQLTEKVAKINNEGESAQDDADKPREETSGKFANRQSERDAATKIQAGYRGYKTRKEINNLAQRSRSNEEIPTKAKSPPLATIKEEEEAATKIQAGIRGFLTRKKMKKSLDMGQSQQTFDMDDGGDKEDELRSPERGRHDSPVIGEGDLGAVSALAKHIVEDTFVSAEAALSSSQSTNAVEAIPEIETSEQKDLTQLTDGLGSSESKLTAEKEPLIPAIPDSNVMPKLHDAVGTGIQLPLPLLAEELECEPEMIKVVIAETNSSVPPPEATIHEESQLSLENEIPAIISSGELNTENKEQDELKCEPEKKDVIASDTESLVKDTEVHSKSQVSEENNMSVLISTREVNPANVEPEDPKCEPKLKKITETSVPPHEGTLYDDSQISPDNKILMAINSGELNPEKIGLDELKCDPEKKDVILPTTESSVQENKEVHSNAQVSLENNMSPSIDIRELNVENVEPEESKCEPELKKIELKETESLVPLNEVTIHDDSQMSLENKKSTLMSSEELNLENKESDVQKCELEIKDVVLTVLPIEATIHDASQMSPENKMPASISSGELNLVDTGLDDLKYELEKMAVILPDTESSVQQKEVHSNSQLSVENNMSESISTRDVNPENVESEEAKCEPESKKIVLTETETPASLPDTTTSEDLQLPEENTFLASVTTREAYPENSDLEESNTSLAEALVAGIQLPVVEDKENKKKLATTKVEEKVEVMPEESISLSPATERLIPEVMAGPSESKLLVSENLAHASEFEQTTTEADSKAEVYPEVVTANEKTIKHEDEIEPVPVDNEKFDFIAEDETNAFTSFTTANEVEDAGSVAASPEPQTAIEMSKPLQAEPTVQEKSEGLPGTEAGKSLTEDSVKQSTTEASPVAAEVKSEKEITHPSPPEVNVLESTISDTAIPVPEPDAVPVQRRSSKRKSASGTEKYRSGVVVDSYFMPEPSATTHEIGKLDELDAEIESESMMLNQAASKIQAGFRGYQVRRNLNTAATKIQSSFRGYKTRKNLKNRVDAAVRIQATVRGYLTRKKINKNKAQKFGQRRKDAAARRRSSASMQAATNFAAFKRHSQ